MQSAPLPSPRCPMCTGSNITPATRLRTSQDARLTIELAVPNPGTWDSNTESFMVNRARVCLDCGYLMVFLNDKKLHQLRLQLAVRVPIPDSED